MASLMLDPLAPRDVGQEEAEAERREGVPSPVLDEEEEEEETEGNHHETPGLEDEEDDGLECRVCRGEAEADRPLYSPCMCAGSIMYTHQDCLLQWLQHSGKEACELCKHKFQFKPVYAEDAPAEISTSQVLLRCGRKAILEGLPFGLRLSLAAALWLCFVPCTTSWVYRIWIFRSSVLVPDLIRQRLTWAHIYKDSVSGIIITTFIIFSFLSLMSFADFLRFHWDVRDGQQEVNRQQVEEGQQAAVVGGGAGDAHDDERWDDGANEGVEGEEGNANHHRQHREARLRPQEGRAAPPPPPPQQQQQGDVGIPGLNQNNDNDADMEQIDVELHVAMDELLGIRGPFPFLLRNILWLIAFNAAYLGLFAFIPYSVGSAVVMAADKYSHNLMFSTLGALVPKTIRDMAGEIAKAAAEEDQTIQLADLGTIVLGYLVVSTMVFTWRSIVGAVCERTALSMNKVVRVLECTAAVVKVGLLLFLKMVFLPLLLGLWLNAATTCIFESSHENRIRFAAGNLVGALLLHWVAGISFMLFVTVSVLQLREVLHPEILARVIRPQEPQPDLLGSLLQESGLTHARRIAMSLAIYVFLLFIFVWLPAQAARHVEPVLSILRLRTFYVAPQLQVPIELILFHLAMLTFLERFKDLMGQLQHWWLLAMCRFLGLSRFLLPYHTQPVREEGDHADVEDSTGQPAMLGQPIMRPPIGFDDHPPNNANNNNHNNADQGGRWAWGSEPLSDLEKTVARRVGPDRLCVVRVAVLAITSWMAVLIVVLLGLLTPLVLGRGCFALLHVPGKFYHDPFAFAFGCCISWVVSHWVSRLRHRITHQRLVRWWAAYRPPPLSASICLAVFLGLWFILSPLVLGLLFELTLVVPSQVWAQEGIACLSPARDWALGLLLLHLGVYLGLLGMLDFQGPQQGRQEGGGETPRVKAALLATLEALKAGVVRWEWERINFREVLKPLVWPLSAHLVEVFALPTNVALLVCLARQQHPGAMAVVLPLPETATQGELQISCFRMTVLAWTLALVSMKCTEPFNRWLQTIHDTVRDENYLIGLQLQNYYA